MKSKKLVIGIIVAVASILLAVGAIAIVFFVMPKGNKDFDISDLESKLVTELTYNGQKQAFYFDSSINGLNVKYSGDGENFKNINEFSGFKDVNTYSLYYQVSANGYNTYTSTDPVTFEIVPKELTIDFIAGHKYSKSSLINIAEEDYKVNDKFSFTKYFTDTLVKNTDYTVDGLVAGDEADLKIKLYQGTTPIETKNNLNTTSGGTSLSFGASINNNYSITNNNNSVTIVDNFKRTKNSDKSFCQYYGDLQTAVNNLDANGDILLLEFDNTVSSVINLNKNFIFDLNGHTLKIDDSVACAFNVVNGVTIDIRNGTIETSNSLINTKVDLILGADLVIDADLLADEKLITLNDGSKLSIKGKIDAGDGVAIYVNGTDALLNIQNTAEIDSTAVALILDKGAINIQEDTTSGDNVQAVIIIGEFIINGGTCENQSETLGEDGNNDCTITKNGGTYNYTASSGNQEN